MIPNRTFPTGTLQLFEIIEGQKFLLEELPSTSKNRDKINQMRNQMLMLDSKRNIQLSENNAIKFTTL